MVKSQGGQLVTQFLQQDTCGIDFLTKPQTNVSCDLVVTGTTCMQTLACVSDEFDQPFLNIQVDVFKVERPVEVVCLDFGKDLFHTALDVGKIRCADEING